jgi:hypothetical protein
MAPDLPPTAGGCRVCPDRRGACDTSRTSRRRRRDKRREPRQHCRPRHRDLVPSGRDRPRSRPRHYKRALPTISARPAPRPGFRGEQDGRHPMWPIGRNVLCERSAQEVTNARDEEMRAPALHLQRGAGWAVRRLLLSALPGGEIHDGAAMRLQSPWVCGRVVCHSRSGDHATIS